MEIKLLNPTTPLRITIPPHAHTHLTSTTMSTSSLLPPPPLLLLRPRPSRTLTPLLLRRPLPIRSSLSDPFVLEVAEKLEDSLPSASLLRRLRQSSSESLLSRQWPSPKLESFRFTDTSFLRRSSVVPTAPPQQLPSLPHPPISPNSVSIVDGHLVPSLSRLDALPDGVYVGAVDAMPAGPGLEKVLGLLEVKGGSFLELDVFWDLNGTGTPDVMVVYVPKHVKAMEEPVHLRFYCGEGAEEGAEGLPLSNPRVVVVAEEGAEVGIVEEHFGVDGMCYWANAVVEVVVGEGARVEHSYVQRQSPNAAHTKWTFVQQETSSTYQFVEISTGGRLSRHNLHVQQVGPGTVTELAAFHLSQKNQTQDLHSKLILNHPKGYSRQIHKSIITNSSGQIVFDGNIKVNRFAQQTDAGQLTRTLLLAPRATANVKPNLQIVADDVKCSHGATISDLEDDQLFYLQARGIDLESARDALVFSFGAEVVAQLPYEPLQKEVANHIKNLLATKESSE